MTTGAGVLGYKVRDKITGFEGVATGYVTYISGCNQVWIAPFGLDKDGKARESHWFDEQRLEIVEGDRTVLENAKAPGFDKAPPAR